jgi:hypothetical protein
MVSGVESLGGITRGLTNYIIANKGIKEATLHCSKEESKMGNHVYATAVIC